MQFCFSWFQRHPLIRQSLLWALPAIGVGLALRLMLLSYLPYAYWGSDSNSYFSFTYTLLEDGKLSLYDKRRYLYPLFLFPITLLPGATLKWLAVIQHIIGIATLIPLAYCVRKSFVAWQWWVIPVTVFYAGLPMILWYEHELLAENLFFAAIVWSAAGWCAWTGEPNPERARRLWWCFFAGVAVFVLLKPSGRFLWPGVLFALTAVASWRILRGREAAALIAVFALSLTIGQDSQGMWLLYTSSFPLTRLETPLHADYKAEIADLVQRARHRLERPDVEDATDTKSWKLFLKNPGKQDERPLWKALDEDLGKRARIYRDLAMEGIQARPDLFARIAWLKIIASANSSEFNANRFDAAHTVEKFQHLYERDATKEPRRMQMLLGLPQDRPLPPYSEIIPQLSPRRDSTCSEWLQRYATRFQTHAAFLDAREDDAERAPLTPLGWWMLAAIPLSLLPGYFRRLGIWTLITICYLFGVFLVGGANPRFFGPAWPIIVLLLPIPADVLLSLVRRCRHPSV